MDKIEMNDIKRFGEIECIISNAIFENYNKRTNELYGYNATELCEYIFIDELELVRIFFKITQGKYMDMMDDFYMTYSELLEKCQ